MDILNKKVCILMEKEGVGFESWNMAHKEISTEIVEIDPALGVCG